MFARGIFSMKNRDKSRSVELFYSLCFSPAAKHLPLAGQGWSPPLTNRTESDSGSL